MLVNATATFENRHHTRGATTSANNTATILGIEWLAAAQGVDFHRPLASSAPLEAAHALLRAQVARYDADRLFAPDIEAAKALVLGGALHGVHPSLWATLWRDTVSATH